MLFIVVVVVVDRVRMITPITVRLVRLDRSFIVLRSTARCLKYFRLSIPSASMHVNCGYSLLSVVDVV